MKKHKAVRSINDPKASKSENVRELCLHGEGSALGRDHGIMLSKAFAESEVKSEQDEACSDDSQGVVFHSVHDSEEDDETRQELGLSFGSLPDSCEIARRKRSLVIKEGDEAAVSPIQSNWLRHIAPLSAQLRGRTSKAVQGSTGPDCNIETLSNLEASVRKQYEELRLGSPILNLPCRFEEFLEGIKQAQAISNPSPTEDGEIITHGKLGLCNNGAAAQVHGCLSKHKPIEDDEGGGKSHAPMGAKGSGNGWSPKVEGSKVNDTDSYTPVSYHVALGGAHMDNILGHDRPHMACNAVGDGFALHAGRKGDKTSLVAADLGASTCLKSDQKAAGTYGVNGTNVSGASGPLSSFDDALATNEVAFALCHKHTRADVLATSEVALETDQTTIDSDADKSSLAGLNGFKQAYAAAHPQMQMRKVVDCEVSSIQGKMVNGNSLGGKFHKNEDNNVLVISYGAENVAPHVQSTNFEITNATKGCTANFMVGPSSFKRDFDAPSIKNASTFIDEPSFAAGIVNESIYAAGGSCVYTRAEIEGEFGIPFVPLKSKVAFDGSISKGDVLLGVSAAHHPKTRGDLVGKERDQPTTPFVVDNSKIAGPNVSCLDPPCLTKGADSLALGSPSLAKLSFKDACFPTYQENCVADQENADTITGLNFGSGSEISPVQTPLGTEFEPNNFTLNHVNHGSCKDLVLHVPKDVIDEGKKEWSTTLVGNFLGKKLPFSLVSQHTNKLWAKSGLMDTLATDSGFFFFIFSCEATRDAALEGGPWFIAGQPLLLRVWTPNFTLGNEDVQRVPIWVNFFGLPLEYWNPKGISFIASFLGKPVRVDRMTACRRRISYARVCVEVSPDFEFFKDFVIEADDDTGGTIFTKIRVEYNWTPPRCTKCSKFGHDCSITKAQVEIPTNHHDRQKRRHFNNHKNYKKKDVRNVWKAIPNRETSKGKVEANTIVTSCRSKECPSSSMMVPHLEEDSIITTIVPSHTFPNLLEEPRRSGDGGLEVLMTNRFHTLPSVDEVGAAMDEVGADMVQVDTDHDTTLDNDFGDDAYDYDDVLERCSSDSVSPSSSRQRKKAAKMKYSGCRPKGRHKS